MRDRGRLIDEAMRWHNRALEAQEGPGGSLADGAEEYRL
jgi:hypothetical protein